MEDNEKTPVRHWSKCDHANKTHLRNKSRGRFEDVGHLFLGRNYWGGNQGDEIFFKDLRFKIFILNRYSRFALQKLRSILDYSKAPMITKSNILNCSLKRIWKLTNKT